MVVNECREPVKKYIIYYFQFFEVRPRLGGLDFADGFNMGPKAIEAIC